MRILLIFNSIALPNDQISFTKTWFYQIGVYLLQRGHKLNNVFDRHLRYEYLPSRVTSQYVLFEADIIFIQLSAEGETHTSIIKNARNMKNLFRAKDKIFLLPTQDKKLNFEIFSFLKYDSFFSLIEYQKLLEKYDTGLSSNEHNLIVDYLKGLV